MSLNISREDILSDVIGTIAGQLGIEPSADIADRAIVDGLGADSLDVIEILVTLEIKYRLNVPDEEIVNIRTANDAADYIAAAYTAK